MPFAIRQTQIHLEAAFLNDQAQGVRLHINSNCLWGLSQNVPSNFFDKERFETEGSEIALNGLHALLAWCHCHRLFPLARCRCAPRRVYTSLL